MAVRFPVIIGPTAGGKSSVALALAERLVAAGGPESEIVSADAFAVYRGMDIGTAKPTEEDRARLPHHLVDIREPEEPFSVDQWLGLAERAIEEIRSRGRLPIVVGGTHFYVRALLEGLFEGPAVDEGLRRELQETAYGEVRAELEQGDPVSAARIHPRDERRTIRAVEILRQTGTPISELQQQWDRGRMREDVLLAGLLWPSEAINRRINARVREMVERGLVEEVMGLWKAGRLGEQAGQALGYKQLVRHFEGEGSLEEAIERVKIETRRFGKNQRTWIRRLLGSNLNSDSTSKKIHEVDPERGPGECVTGQRCAFGADNKSTDEIAQNLANTLLAQF